MTSRIDSIIHVCIIQDGDMAGNTYNHDVTPSDYEFEELCNYCGDRLVTTEQLFAHIYRELLE